ncbi:MAG: hypothetical protein ACOH5I_05365 [Oligoflexus sp.]
MSKSTKCIATILILALAAISRQGFAISPEQDWFSAAVEAANAELLAQTDRLPMKEVKNTNILSQAVPQEGSVAELLSLSSIPVAQLLSLDQAEFKKITMPPVPTVAEELVADEEVKLAPPPPAAGFELSEPIAELKSPPPSDSDCVLQPCLKVFQEQRLKHWMVEPKRLDLAISDDHVQVSVEGNDAPLLFVRDEAILKWDAEKQQLRVKNSGTTELYVVDEQKMLIVPIHVTLGNTPNKERKVQTAPPDLIASSDLLSLKPLPGLSYGPRQVRRQVQNDMRAVHVQAFDAEGRPIAEPNAEQRPSYGLLGVESQRKTVTVQLIDERSVIEAEKLYPVKDARVKVLGTGWQGVTDIRGVVDIPDMPEGSRFLLQVDHPGGQIPLHTYEVFVDFADGPQLELLTVMTYRSFFLYSQIFQVAQRTDRASVCLSVHSRDGAETLDGLQVTLNNKSGDGPFYFNRFGPDPQATTTDEAGRFCLFNVEAGLTEISFFQDDGQYLSSVAVPLISGSHLDDSVYLWNGPAMELRLSAMPTALEQLYSDFDQYMTFHPVDYVSMISIGDNEELSSKNVGVLEAQAGHSWYRGKSYLLSQAPEFETTLFGVNHSSLVSNGRIMTPLLPRGFVEDLFQELYMAETNLVEAFDSYFGSVVVLFGQSEEEEKAQQGAVKIRLIDQFGVQTKDGWYFGSGADGLSKAIFFNLQPGIYSVIVESKDGMWLDFETVAVDYMTTSLVQTGHVLGEVLE